MIIDIDNPYKELFIYKTISFLFDGRIVVNFDKFYIYFN